MEETLSALFHRENGKEEKRERMREWKKMYRERAYMRMVKNKPWTERIKLKPELCTHERTNSSLLTLFMLLFRPEESEHSINNNGKTFPMGLTVN